MARKHAAALRATLIPFDRETSGHIFVMVRISGKAARFAIDSGAGATCIHSGYLKRYKLTPSTRGQKVGGLGTSTMRMATVRGHDLTVAGIELSPVKLVALDLSHVLASLGKTKGPPVVGILGADVLHRYRAVLDFGRGFAVFFH